MFLYIDIAFCHKSNGIFFFWRPSLGSSATCVSIWWLGRPWAIICRFLAPSVFCDKSMEYCFFFRYGCSRPSFFLKNNDDFNVCIWCSYTWILFSVTSLEECCCFWRASPTCAPAWWLGQPWVVSLGGCFWLLLLLAASGCSWLLLAAPPNLFNYVYTHIH